MKKYFPGRNVYLSPTTGGQIFEPCGCLLFVVHLYCLIVFFLSFLLLTLFSAQKVEESRCDKEVSDDLETEERSPKGSPEQSMADADVLLDYQSSSFASDQSLVKSPEPSNHSLTFVTPSSSIFTTPQSSQKPTVHDEFFPGNESKHTPFGTASIGDDALEEKPPRDEKHVTSTPYLGSGSLRDSIDKRFHAGSRLSTWSQTVTPGESFMEEMGKVSLSRYCQVTLK